MTKGEEVIEYGFFDMHAAEFYSYEDIVRLNRAVVTSYMSVEHNQVIYAYGSRPYTEAEVRVRCKGKDIPHED